MRHGSALRLRVYLLDLHDWNLPGHLPELAARARDGLYSYSQLGLRELHVCDRGWVRGLLLRYERRVGLLRCRLWTVILRSHRRRERDRESQSLRRQEPADDLSPRLLHVPHEHPVRGPPSSSSRESATSIRVKAARCLTIVARCFASAAR